MQALALFMQATKSKSAPRQSRQSEGSETPTHGPGSEVHDHEPAGAGHISTADAASTSPSEHVDAQPSSAQQARQGAAAPFLAAESAAQPMEEPVVATTPAHQQPTASTKASVHMEQSGASQPGMAGNLPSCSATSVVN